MSSTCLFGTTDYENGSRLAEPWTHVVVGLNGAKSPGMSLTLDAFENNGLSLSLRGGAREGDFRSSCILELLESGFSREKAGLRTGCGVRSQVIDVLEAQIKRRPAMKKVSTVAAKPSRNLSQQRLTIGLNLGDRNRWCCVMDEAGQIQLEQRVRTSAKALQQVFGTMPRSRIGLEIGTHSPWISRLLSGLGQK